MESHDCFFIQTIEGKKKDESLDVSVKLSSVELGHGGPSNIQSMTRD